MIKAVRGDITKVDDVDAIVNAANVTLLGGGGVDGAIHRAAGAKLRIECMKLCGCKTGEAKITGAYKLPCEYIIHTVGPVWHNGKNNEEAMLEKCYYNSMQVARDNGIRRIAFPSISTGVYNFPVSLAAKIAVRTVRDYINANPDAFDLVEWVLFDDDTFNIYNSEISLN